MFAMIIRSSCRSIATALIGMVATASMISAARASPPQIDVSCSLSDIHDDPRDDQIWADVTFNWSATNAEYVLILEQGGAHRPLTGSTAPIEGGASLTFVAVKGGEAVVRPIACQHVYRRGTGVHGLIHSISYEPTPGREFTGSYVASFHSLKSLEVVSNIVSAYLQRANFRSVRVPAATSGAIIYTPDFSLDPSLCQGDDCGLAIGSRAIVRQVAYSIWIERGSVSGDYRLHVSPTVMFNRPRQDDEWAADPDGTQLASNRCNTLLHDLTALM